MSADDGLLTEDGGCGVEVPNTLTHSQYSTSTTGQQPSVIVIGYGNALRGDDAVGCQTVEQVARWELAHVAVLTVHQLTPELAATLADYDEALFVDASHDTKISLRLITPHTIERANTHTCDPRGLLALADALYRHCPRTWWLTIPTTHYALGAPLSSVAHAGMQDALQMIHSLLDTARR